MDHEERNKSNKGIRRFKGTMHLGMGTFYIMAALLLFYVKKFGQINLSGGVAYTLSVFFVLYGIFRIWRGWTDLNARDEDRND